MVLTVKQKEELNLAIFEYLKNNAYGESASVFEVDAEVYFVFVNNASYSSKKVKSKKHKTY